MRINFVFGLFIYLLLFVISLMIGGYIATSAYMGTISLIGLIVLVETIRPLRWLLRRGSSVLDILIFVFTILATMTYGLNVASSLTFAGIGYTLVYAPYLRNGSVIIFNSLREDYRNNFND